MFDVERLRNPPSEDAKRRVAYRTMTNAMSDAADEIERLRECLADTREEICKGPVGDTLWHTGIPACTTVDNICLTLRDDWDYDQWLARNVNASMENGQ